MLAMGGGHGGETLPMAQAIKDATMAHFILSNLFEGSPICSLQRRLPQPRW